MILAGHRGGLCASRAADAAGPNRRTLAICYCEPVRATIRGGVPKLATQDGCQLVRLIPEELNLPFAASLEYLCPSSSLQHSQHEHFGPSTSSDIIELTYVLSGSGCLREFQSDMAWPLQPGTSMITWANSTYLQSEEHQQQQQQHGQSQEQGPDEPLAVLKFHLPLSLLDPSCPVTTLSRAQRTALSEAQGAALPTATSHAAAAMATQGTLEDADAVKLLQAAGARTRKALKGTPAPVTPLTHAHTHSNHGVQGMPNQGPHPVSAGMGLIQGARPGMQGAIRALSMGLAALQQGTHDFAGMLFDRRMVAGDAGRAGAGSSGAAAGLGVLAAGVAALQQGRGEATVALLGLLAGPLARLPVSLSWSSPSHTVGTRRLPDLTLNLANTAVHTAANLAAPLITHGLPQLHRFLPNRLRRGQQQPSPSHHTLDFLHQSTDKAASIPAHQPHPVTPIFPIGSLPLRADGSLALGSIGTDAFGAQLSRSQCVLMARTMEDFKAFRFPAQTNQLAFVFDPLELGLSLSFGVEIFEPGHHTPLHVHRTGHELFFLLSGEGDAYCDGQHIPVQAGDCVVFPPGSLHGLDNNTPRKMYALQMMCPDDEFVAYVQSGTSVGRLNDEDICNLTANRC